MWMDILLGLLRIFLQPLLYVLLVFAFFVSYYRVLRERRDFHVRFYGVLNGLIESILPGLLMGLAGSIVVLAAGMVLSPGMIVLMSALYIVAALTMQLRLMSPIFTVGVAAIVAYFFPDVHTPYALINGWIAGIRGTSIVSSVLLMGMLVLAEAIMIRILGVRTAPRLLPGKRGKTVGAHEARKFWFVPLCLLLPGGAIPHVWHWPFIGNGEHFSLLLVPFGLSFYHLITTTAPKRAVVSVAKRNGLAAIVVILLAAYAWYSGNEWLALIAAAGAIVYRLVTLLFESLQRKREAFYFRQRNDGLTVLGLLPGSPAEKLGIEVGECIHKVNGRLITEERDFYEALQENAAFCKMEVIDEMGEIRFVQGALYDGTHHELGLLFVTRPKTASAK